MEYFVTGANMFFYWSIAGDFAEEEVVVVRPTDVGGGGGGAVANGHAPCPLKDGKKID